ncbi:MAG: COG3650 family protein [Paracoccus sp. (in: a-proteobacteria)]|uniref:COG3650 family protein n=1 Tax=Paracoccus sp. TaxID=267 RepID=UPI00391D2A70
MIMRFTLLALLTLPLAACDGEAMSDLRRNLGIDEAEAPPEEPTGPRPPAVSPLVAPIETGEAAATPVAIIEPLTAQATAFVARGNEPFWNVQVAGNTATYRTPENQNGRQIQVNRLSFAGGVEYIGVLGGRPFVLNMRPGQCQDSMADQRFPLTARLTVSGNTVEGCASPGTPRTPDAATPDAAES